MQDDLVSIVIPTYNRFEKLERAVISAINQTYKKIEIIITSDNDDETNKILREKYEKLDLRIKFVVNNSGEKCVGNWNNGLSYADGEFIKILFDDDWMNDNCIEVCIDKIGIHNGVTFKCNNHLLDGTITCGPELNWGSYNDNEALKLLTSLNCDGFFEFCISPCAYFFKNKNIKFRTDFSNEEKVKKWGSGSDIVYIIENLMLQTRCKDECLMCIENCLVNFDSHADSCTVKNLPEVLRLTKEGMFFAKKIYNKTEIRFI